MHRRCQFFGSCFYSIVTAMALVVEILRVTTELLKMKIVASGLADDQVFEAVNFSSVDDLISSLFPKMG